MSRLIPKHTNTQTIEALSTDKVRNNLIIEDVKTVIAEGRTPIILTNLTSHVRILTELLQPHAMHVVSLVGADSAKREKIWQWKNWIRLPILILWS